MSNAILFSHSALFRFSLTSIISADTDIGMDVTKGNIKIHEFSSVNDLVHHISSSGSGVVIFDIDGVPKEKQIIVFNAIKRARTNICLLVFCQYEPDSTYYCSLSQIARFIISKKDSVGEIVSTINYLFILVKKARSRAFSVGKDMNVWLGLSPREQEVMSLASLGLDYLAISKEMGVTRKTVSNYICRLRNKYQFDRNANMFFKYNTH